MHMMIVKAVADGSGPDITGRIVPMPAGSYHLCREDDRSWFEQRSDVFSFVTQRDDNLAPTVHKLDNNGNVTGLVGPDGTEYEVINDISELIPEYTPSASASAGVKGTITRDASYLYVCTATNTWERVAIATW